MSSPPAPRARPLDPRPSSLPVEARSGSGAGTAAGQPSLLERLQQWLDRLLVLDVFLVIGAALWFGTAVVLHAQGVEVPLQLFQRLWEPLFTPAIGLLMAAALVSGALGWWRRRGQR
jgi:hypothetical protein